MQGNTFKDVENNCLNTDKSVFYSFVPRESNKLLACWINALNINIKVSNPRKTKLGDFKIKGDDMTISINNNLNKYSFLITLVHELSHAFVFKKYKYRVKPHGKSWQLTFKSLMLNFLTPDFFPKDILKVLSAHMIAPKASTFSDLELVKVLRRYDTETSLVVSDLAYGDLFMDSRNKIFVKGTKNRKRYRCLEQKTNRLYLFHAYTQVIKVK